MRQTAIVARIILCKGDITRPEAANLNILELKGRIRSLGRMLAKNPKLNMSSKRFPFQNIGSPKGHPKKYKGKFIHWAVYKLRPGWKRKLKKLCIKKRW